MKKSKKVYEIVSCMCQKNDNYNKKELINEAFKSSLDFISKPILKSGNLKLDENIARYALPEVVTCSTSCKGCYAKKRLFRNVAKSRLVNLFNIVHVLNNYIIKTLFKEKIKFELKLHDFKCQLLNKKSIMRWHDSGDIFNLDYFNLILEIAHENPEILFYTYTKNMIVWSEYKKLQKTGMLPNNFNIVCSFIYNHVNYFDFITNFKSEFKALKDIIKKARKDNIKIHLCNYAIDKINPDDREKLYAFINKNNDVITCYKNHLSCGNCVKCCNSEHVIFIKH